MSEGKDLTGKVNLGGSVERLSLVRIGRHATDERSMTSGISSGQYAERGGGRVAQLGEGHDVPGANPRVLTFGAPSVGEILAERYQLEEHIGNDSLGRQLYRGIDVILRRPVAVVLRYPGGDSAREMLAAAVAASRIVHPHLVGVYDAIDEGERAYVVREWVEGVALREIVSAGPLDAARSVAVAWAVTDAVAALHATGMAHGNIHPGTVLVAHDGRVVLTDARTDDAATPETDIRSIGAVLYCSLTGYWPHAEAGPASVPDGVRDSQGVLAAPRQVRAGVPTHLDALASDLLNTNLPLPPADALAAELASFGQTEEDINYAAGTNALDLDAFDSASESPAPVRPAGRKLAIGVVGLLVLALIGTLAAARVLGGSDANTTPTSGTPSGHSATQPGAGGASGPTKAPVQGAPRVLSLTGSQVRIVEPKGDRDDELKNADRMVDGDPNTVWKTQGYQHSANFGNLKPGIGVLIDLQTAQKVVSVQVDFNTGGATAELKAGDSDPGNTSAGDTTLVSTFPTVGDVKTDTGTRVVFQGPDQPKRYLLVWITSLPKDKDGSYRIAIGQLTVSVQ
jgi:eukaryotic-like serine/threonine-protein kinase